MDDLKNLIQEIRERALIKGQTFTLASGKSSNIYVDCKQVTLWSKSLARISRLFVEKLESTGARPDYVAGVSIGGDPLVAGFLMESEKRGRIIEGLLIRKEAKDHGRSAGRKWEGREPGPQHKIWLLEDVISTGKSSLSAADTLKEQKFQLAGILCIVDREMGGVESLSDRLGVPVLALCKLSQISDA